MNNVKLIIYKKIVPGDLRKFTATSNDTQSGGGARDLRFSPADEFMRAFEKMFPNASGGKRTGYFSWNGIPETYVEIHQPTDARPNEVRIATVHKCFPAQVIPTDATDCILILVQDNLGKVWPYFTSENSLRNDNWHPEIKRGILNGLGASRASRTTPMGYIDLETGVQYTNGR